MLPLPPKGRQVRPSQHGPGPELGMQSYTLLEGARDGGARLTTAYRTPDNLDRAIVLIEAIALAVRHG